MSETLEPRQVGRPFLGRWVRSTFALLTGSPRTFGAAVVLLAILDLFYTDVTPMRLIDAGLTLLVGALLLPVFWIAMSLVSRRADRARGRSEQRELVVCGRVWAGGLLSGCVLAATNWLLHWALSASAAYADVIGSYALNSLLLGVARSVLLPFDGLAPGLTMLEAWQLSRKASSLNSEWVIVGTVLWNGSPVANLSQLEGYFRAESRRNPQPEVHLRPSPYVKYGVVAQVLAAAQRSRLDKLGFVNSAAFAE